MYHQRSEDVARGVAERGNDEGKQGEEPISAPDDISSPAELDSGENCALLKSLFRARKMNGKTPAKVTQDRSPKVVEIFAMRGFQV